MSPFIPALFIFILGSSFLETAFGYFSCSASSAGIRPARYEISFVEPAETNPRFFRSNVIYFSFFSGGIFRGDLQKLPHPLAKTERIPAEYLDFSERSYSPPWGYWMRAPDGSFLVHQSFDDPTQVRVFTKTSESNPIRSPRLIYNPLGLKLLGVADSGFVLGEIDSGQTHLHLVIHNPNGRVVQDGRLQLDRAIKGSNYFVVPGWTLFYANGTLNAKFLLSTTPNDEGIVTGRTP